MCTKIVSLLNVEQLLTCPYDPAHRIRRFKMCVHINKCRKNYAKNNPDQTMKACVYNTNHVVPEMEWEFHMEECEDRIKGDRERYKIQSDVEPLAENPAVTIPLNAIPDIECDDDWSTPQAVISVNAAIQANLAERKVIVPLQGATKSERKAHYVQERRRHNNMEDQTKPSTSRVVAPPDPRQPLRKPRTESMVSVSSVASAPSPVFQVPQSAQAKQVEKPKAAAKSPVPLMNENIKPQQAFPKGRGRVPGQSAAVPKPEPKIGSQAPWNNQPVARQPEPKPVLSQPEPIAAKSVALQPEPKASKPTTPKPEPKVGVLSENKANSSTDLSKQFAFDKDGFFCLPIPNKGRGRKQNPSN